MGFKLITPAQTRDILWHRGEVAAILKLVNTRWL